MKRIIGSALGLSIMMALSACGGGGGSAAAPAAPPLATPSPSPVPTSLVIPVISPTPLFNAQTTSLVVNLPNVSASSSITDIGMTVFIPNGGTAPASANHRTAKALGDFVSPLTNSMSVAFGSATPAKYDLSSNSDSCKPAGDIGRLCTVNVHYSPSFTPAMYIAMFQSKDASGTPLSVSTVDVPTSDAPAQKLEPALTPVLDALSVKLDGAIEPGEPGDAKVVVSAFAPGGVPIDLSTSKIVDKTGKPLKITVSENEATDAITLASTDGGTGTPIDLHYNGNLPLAKTTISVVAKAGTATSKTTSLVVANPSPSSNFTFSTGDANVVDTSMAQLPSSVGNYVPDMKFSVIHRTDGKYLFFWNLTHASLGDGPQPESQGAAHEAYVKNQPWEAAGAWFLNVFPKNAPFANSDSTHLISLYHAESAVTGFYDKTMAVSYSDDGGATWSNGRQIITPPGYPSVQEAGYSADSAAMWDPVKKQWVVFYSPGNMVEAISTDPNAAPGTWKKYCNGSFSQPGLGGDQNPIASLSDHHFSSPAVSWNSYLQKWVMLMDGHPGIWMSTSPDLYTWAAAKQVTDGGDIGATAVGYATLIGRNGDKVSNEKSDLYYGKFLADGNRVLMHRTLTFHRSD